MAESTISGDVGGGIQLTCILEEGAITVNDSAMNSSGTMERGYSLATPLPKGLPVTLYDSTEATYDATMGMPLVRTTANADTKGIGRIVSEPRWVKLPASTGVADTLTKRLAAQYYRVATIELAGGITSIFDVKLVTADAIAIVPGVKTSLTVDASLTAAAGKIVLTDASGTGVGFIPFHYCAKAAGSTVTILVGVYDLFTVVT